MPEVGKRSGRRACARIDVPETEDQTRFRASYMLALGTRRRLAPGTAYPKSSLPGCRPLDVGRLDRFVLEPLGREAASSELCARRSSSPEVWWGFDEPVNPNGQATSFHYVYGTTTARGNSTPTASAGSRTAATGASVILTGLTPNTTYH